MIERLLALEWKDIFIAASAAYVIFYILRSLQKMFGRKGGFAVSARNMDVAEVYERCKDLFPIQRLTFQGKVFTRGMRIRIVTRQNASFEGELIGLNKVDLICIRTQNQIIAHQLEKVQEIVPVEQ